MCNAYNHPSYCTCGWGGWTSFVRPSDKAGNASVNFWRSMWSSGRLARYETYTCPNCTCWICGAKVFFYQSPFGGRVFFDELGPPWPRHACFAKTDSALIKAPEPSGYILPSVSPSSCPSVWSRDGWDPIEIISSALSDKKEDQDFYILEVRRVAAAEGTLCLGAHLKKNIARDTPVFLRETDMIGVYEIDYLDAENLNSSGERLKAYQNANSAAAYEYWQLATLDNDPKAQNYVAMLLLFYTPFRFLKGVSVDDAPSIMEARYWLEKAASGNAIAAVCNLKRLNERQMEGKPFFRSEYQLD